MNVWPVLLSWRMAWVAACRWVKPNIYAALHANNWSPKNIPSYGYRKRTRRRSLTSHEERRMDDAWSSLLLHQKLRPVQQIDARAGRGASGSLVHLAPALLPGTGDCLLVDRYASASWRNHLTASRVRTWILALAARHGSTYEVCCVSTGWFADCKIQLYGNACIANLHCKAFFRLLWDIF